MKKPKKALKPLYRTYTCRAGEAELFFDENFKLITWWSLNDAHLRDEYMGPLFEHMGYEIKEIDWNDPRIKETVVKELIECCGATEEDFEDD